MGEKMNKLLICFAISIYFAISICFAISIVSALEFDDIKSYNTATKTATIKNAFGLGDVIGTAKLNTPQYNIVPVGYGKVMEYEIDAAEIYKDGIGAMYSYDQREGNQEIYREYDIKIKSYETVTRDVYGYVTLKNGSQSYQKIGVENYQREVWTDFNDKDLPKGKITIGIFTEVKEGDIIDLVPTLFRKKMDEWAIFAADAALKLVYTLNSTSGIIVPNSINTTHYMNASGAPTWIAGKHNNAINISGGTNAYAENSSMGSAGLGTGSSPLSICGWFYITSGAQDDALWALYDAASPTYNFVTYFSSNDMTALKFDAYQGSPNTVQVDISANANQWTQICQTVNSTHNTAYVNGAVRGTTAMAGTWSTFNFLTLGNDRASTGRTRALNGAIDEFYVWNRSLTPSDVSDLYSGGTGFFMPFIIQNVTQALITPVNESIFYSQNSSTASFNLNISYTPSNATGTQCYWNSTWQAATTQINCNEDNLITLNNVFGEQTIYAFVNDTSQNNFRNQTTITIHRNYFNGALGYETDSQTLSLEVWNQTTAPTSGVLDYNGTNYTATITSIGGNKYTINRTLDIPTGVQTRSFKWFWNDGSLQTSNTLNQTVNGSYWVLTNTTVNVPFFNITFQDETNGTSLGGLIDSSSWNFYLGSGTTNKTYTFSNSTAHFNYSFSFSPPHKTVSNDFTITYSAAGYPSRVYNPSVQSFTNTTTTQILYLLSNDDGIYSSFQTTDITNAVIEGVDLTVELFVSGQWVVVASGTTDSSGLFTAWLNPTSTYRVTATKSGYETQQVTVQPSQSVYTIIMPGTGQEDSEYNGTTEGMLWTVTPHLGFMVPGTYEFGFNLTASLGNLESCKFELYDFSSEAILTSSTGGTAYGCNITLTYTFPSADEFDVVGKLYVDTTSTDGFYLIDADQRWRLFETNYSTWTDLQNWIGDLKDYPEFGEGYRQEYSRIIIFFFMLTVLTGILTYFTNVDLTNPGYVLVIMLMITIPFSAAGWFTIEFGSPNSNAWMEQYWLSTILFLLTGGYWLNQWNRY